MGLGPPVCQHCQVLASFDHSKHIWYCEYCGEISDKRFRELQHNERIIKRFYNFMKGKDSNVID